MKIGLYSWEWVNELINENMIVFVGIGEWINKWKYDCICGNGWMNK